MRQSKSKALKKHTKRRAKERFGIEVDPVVLGKIIRNGEGTFVYRQSHRVTVWDVEYKNEHIRVVYDTIRHIPITVLTNEMQ